MGESHQVGNTRLARNSHRPRHFLDNEANLGSSDEPIADGNRLIAIGVPSQATAHSPLTSLFWSEQSSSGRHPKAEGADSTAILPIDSVPQSVAVADSLSRSMGKACPLQRLEECRDECSSGGRLPSCFQGSARLP